MKSRMEQGDTVRVRRSSGRCRAWVGLLLVVAGSPALAQTRTIEGRIIYGPIDSSQEERVDAEDYLTQGDPIPFVTVKLKKGAKNLGEDITDRDGRFSIGVTGSPSLTIVTKAKNDYVTVSESLDGFGNAIKTVRDLNVSYGGTSCPASGGTCDIGNVSVVNDDVDTWSSIEFDGKTFIDHGESFVSRAFYVAGAVHSSQARTEELHGTAMTGKGVTVRMGADETSGSYDRLAHKISLNSGSSVAIWHEFGHFVEDKISSIVMVPSYRSKGHDGCEQITSITNPNLCSAWFEGLATWVGAVNALEHYGSTAPLAAFRSDLNLEPEWCLWGDINSWNEPRAVESVIASVLWDLIDTVEDPTPALNSSEVEEVAEVPIEYVYSVFTADVPGHSPCSGIDIYKHPVGLDEFWDEFVSQYPEKKPDLYSAFAHNGADIGAAKDREAPRPVTLSSTFEPDHGVWINGPLQLTITDGWDDVSGSYYYYLDANLDRSTTIDPETGFLFLESKSAKNEEEFFLPEGAGWYLHVTTRDLAGFDNEKTSHFGPVNVDLTPPFWTAEPLPPEESVLVIGYPVEISWASDDALSGVARVEVVYEDLSHGISVPLIETSQASGTVEWIVEDVLETSLAAIEILVTDRAGNTLVRTIPVDTRAPFQASEHLLDLDHARVISADLDGDGTDEVVLAGQRGGAGEVFVFRHFPQSGFIGAALPFSWSIVDDLVPADVDRDGDVDVVTISRAFGGTSEVEILLNDGVGRLSNSGFVQPIGMLTRQVVRIGTLFGEPTPVVLIFGMETALSGASEPRIHAYQLAPPFDSVPLPGLEGIDGDWEMADLDGDGWTDFVAVGTDRNNNVGLSVFWGTATGWLRSEIASYSGASDVALDIGDLDNDGAADIFVMRRSGGLRTTKVLRNTGSGFAVLEEAVVPEFEIAEGDGKIVDFENDARGEVVAVGRADVSVGLSSWAVRNNGHYGRGQVFAPQNIEALSDGDSAWGDFDGDRDLDFFQVGDNENARFEVNHYISLIADHVKANENPPSPINLGSVYDEVSGGYVFSWEAPGVESDETPEAAFSYELVVLNTKTGELVRSWIGGAGPGLNGQSLEHFVALPKGDYEARVRAVDSGWRRSLPSDVHKTWP